MDSNAALLFLGSRRKDYEKFTGDLYKGLDLKFKPPCDVLENFADLPFYFSQQFLPSVLFLESDNSLRPENFEKVLKNFLVSKKELMKDSAVFWIREGLPSAQEVKNLLSQGLTGFIGSNFQVSEIEDLLAETLSEKIALKPRLMRLDEKIDLELTMASLEQGVAAEIFNIGLGGIFVRGLPPNIKIGTEVRFKFKLNPQLSNSIGGNNPLADFEESAHTKREQLAGRAVVAWIRTLDSKEGPQGFGAQFLDLDAPAKRSLSHFIAHRSAKAFIPSA